MPGNHKCHAHGCERNVRPRMFVCRSHWAQLPKVFQDAIWREYRPGQERDKKPSARYMAVQRAAVARLAFKPDDEEAARISSTYLVAAMKFRKLAIEAGDGDPLTWLPGTTTQESRNAG